MKLYINENHRQGHIRPEIYGHFSEHLGRCIYEGIFVGEDSEIPNVNGMRRDVVEALREIWIPVLRWPGGCFADEYHWRDGIGPKESRKRMINTHWGGVVEDNSFGTHEFFELCRQLGCKSYVNGNVGSGTVQEMSEWVEYMSFDGVSPMAELRRKNGQDAAWCVDYFGVGNENWGCGGNMTAAQYAQEYRRYQTYVRNYDRNAPIFKICGGANADDYEWTRTVMEECFRSPAPEEAHGYMDGYSVHYYVGVEKGEHKGSATEFDENVWYETMKRAFGMEELISRHGAIMDQYDPERRVGMMVDEWGCWHDVEPGTNPGFLYQQNTMRDAVVAGLTLNIFNRRCDRVRMACIAQAVNVLQSVLLTDGPRMVKTPTWYVFHMYRFHQDADLVYSWLSGAEETGLGENRVPGIVESVSADAQGIITATLSNLSLDRDEELEIVLTEKRPQSVQITRLSGAMNAYNSFEEPEKLKEEEIREYELTERGVRLTIPACSVTTVRIA
ncbi:alpha-N-arabinofuranosidase [Lachnoclostridium sp. Marseille-P6806]|uniref:alpha-N-arabinofuranosidase n=1 Tax=Lachnoclostridium sp. Marseille-P6806 TaxID=2364793 RepID=UPI0010309B13|nr:alpha-L-arabinofuranosidase C-terminal domain-containing protein [Lachnoclostridium sp. Marseille-P6806]